MATAYIYMHCPIRREVMTLGRLSVSGSRGEFRYSPAALEAPHWVPDPIRYPVMDRTYTVIKNRGIPGFICDAMPDGWGERLLSKGAGTELSAMEILMQSPNSDRAGNLMVGPDRDPRPGIGSGAIHRFNDEALEHFKTVCDAITDGRLSEEDIRRLRLRDQRSSAGGMRPKRSFMTPDGLVLAKPRDRFDSFDLPRFEHACMTFAKEKGFGVARTQLLDGDTGSTLLVNHLVVLYRQSRASLKIATLIEVLRRSQQVLDQAEPTAYAMLAEIHLRPGAYPSQMRQSEL